MFLTLGLPVQGMEWLLKMYLEGECSDYRFTYDAYAPAASQLISSLRTAGAPDPSCAESPDEQADGNTPGGGPTDGDPDTPISAPQPVRSQVMHSDLNLHSCRQPTALS